MHLIIIDTHHQNRETNGDINKRVMKDRRLRKIKGVEMLEVKE